MIEYKVISVGILNSGNLGAIARVCDNFNVQQLMLVDPKCSVNDEAYERATNARAYLDSVYITDTLDLAKKEVDMLLAFSARTAGTKSLTRSSLDIFQLHDIFEGYSGSVGIVLGPEDHGLTNDEINKCDLLVHIPMPSENQVLNISHALAVGLWELTRTQTLIPETESEHRLMTGAERAAFLNMLESVLQYTWLEEEKHYGIMKVFQTFLGRASVTQREANTLIGSIRAIHKALANPEPPWRSENEQKTP